MERTKYILIIAFGLISVTSSGTNKSLIYNAFITGDMGRWKEVIDKMEETEDKSNDFILELVNYQIGYIGYCVGKRIYDEAKWYMKKSERHLEYLSSVDYKPSYVKSYQGAINGLKIGIDMYNALFLGPGILSKAKDAIRLDSRNPNGYILLGNSKYYMWAVLGGSKRLALNYYKMAEKIMEIENITYENWNYLSLLSMIAHACFNMGRSKEADRYYKKILSIEPDYKWIKEEIYPQFLRSYEKK